MLNRKYYPFERNNYYFGKLLTARDFEAEQRYINDKRRFMNRLNGTCGIVAGLGVIVADDASIILQAGCALDASGREIVVPETKVIKLSTIEGYQELTGNAAYLGISYDEQPADEVYSVMSDDNGGVRHNKIKEGYKLTLLDESMAAKIPGVLDEFVSKLIVYADQDVEIAQYTPRFLPRDAALGIKVQITRLCPGEGDYSFAYRLETPGFKNESGQAFSEVVLNNVRLGYGENRVLRLFFAPEAHLWGGGGVSISVTDFSIRRGDEAFSLNQKLEATIKPVDQNAEELYFSTYYGKAMDKTLAESYDTRLWIAKINLIRQRSSTIIDSIAPPPFGQYCYNAQQVMALSRLKAYYEADVRKVAVAPASAPAQEMQSVVAQAVDSGSLKATATGVFNLSLGLGYAPKEPLYSEEIMHGLGKGPVYVEVGVEYITVDEKVGSSSEIILGDASVFQNYDKNSTEERLYNFTTAVKVLAERGTFIVGVRIGQVSNLISLRIRWFAFKLGEVSKQIKTVKREGERMILVNPDTIILPPKGTAHISPVFINMPTEACRYRLMDSEGGSIDQNGVYTAPAKEGAYEIRVEALSDPTVYTHVFAIVSQKKKD